MNVANNNSNDQVFNELYALLEWTFDLKLTPDDKAIFETEVFRGWDNADDSDRDFVGYLLHLKETLWSAPPSRRKSVKPQTRNLFRQAFSIRESNDRGRIVATLHSLIERRSPGITGIAGAAPLRTTPQLTVPAQMNQPLPAPPAQVAPAPNIAAQMAAYALPDPAAGGAPLTADQMMAIKKRTNWDSQMSSLTNYIHDEEHKRIMGMFK
jgi:hypothetical protein